MLRIILILFIILLALTLFRQLDLLGMGTIPPVPHKVFVPIYHVLGSTPPCGVYWYC